MKKERLLELAGITQLNEAAGLIAVPFDDSFEGDSSWGDRGFVPNDKPMKEQIIDYIKKDMAGVDEEEIKEYTSEIKSVLYVPADLYKLVDKASGKAEIGGDGDSYAITSFVKALFATAAKKKEKIKF